MLFVLLFYECKLLNTSHKLRGPFLSLSCDVNQPTQCTVATGEWMIRHVVGNTPICDVAKGNILKQLLGNGL